jgi:hypothetical protein
VLALTTVIASTFTLVGFTKHTPVERSYKDAYRFAHAAAKRYHLQRDHLQHRLTRRVLEVRRLQRRVGKLTRKLRRERAKAGADVLSNRLERAFLCIHAGEGSWTANTGNGYFGGLQQDRQFQSAYGAEFLRYFGTADRWPVSVQLAVAIRAYISGRGFYPWPNTARACGLL